MSEGARAFDLLRWKGMLAEGSPGLRRTVACVLALCCLVLSLTQWGFIGLQFADGSSAYVVILLLPVALSAVTLGTLFGAAMGLWSGTVLVLHARWLPLAYYEYRYVGLLPSVVCLLVCGLLGGLLFAAIMRRGVTGWRRAALMALSCLAVSASYSAIQAVFAEALGVFQTVTQTMVNAVLLWSVSFVGLVVAERGNRMADRAGLRAIFRLRLSTVVIVAFMAVTVAVYVGISTSSVAGAQADMRGEAEYLLGMFRRNESLDESVSDYYAMAMPQSSHDAANDLGGALSDTVLRDHMAGYAEDADGLMVVAKDGMVIASNVERIRHGKSLVDEMGQSLLNEAQISSDTGEIRRVLYYAPSKYDDMLNVPLPGDPPYAFESLLVWQAGFLVAASDGSYQVITIRPPSLVFQNLDEVAIWMTFSALVILVAVFLFVQRLLDQLVARRIDATNEVLARVTAGDLEAKVPSEGTYEFRSLSQGINQTVTSLKGWIADAASRMDSELQAARGIQESALPRVFPPYPDIRHFDIYASMNAAKEVGGDFYDFFLIGEESGQDAGKLAFVVADVSGKGVPAALFMMKAKTMIHDYLQSGMEIGEAVENANRQLCDGNDEDMFVTAWVGVLDYGTLHVDFVNAGHNPPLVQHDWTWSRLEQTSGMPLGLFDGLTYVTYGMDCLPGDMFFIYTDGVTEAFSVSEEQFGEERLQSVLDEGVALHPRDLVDRVSFAVTSHAEGAEQSDDITMLALEVGVPPEEKAVLTVSANTGELGRIFDFLHTELDQRLCPVRVQNMLDIAVEELFVNVCTYAYEGMGDDAERYVRVTYAYSADPISITVEIIDDGMPFDPLTMSDAGDRDQGEGARRASDGGLGLFMVKRSVDDIWYERQGDSNVVTLVKRW